MPDTGLSHGELSAVPQDLTAAVVAEAGRDAQATARFLDCLFREFERRYPENGPAESYRGTFSARQLLMLGAALRILRWEHSGLVRPFMGLPPAMQAIACAIHGMELESRSEQLFDQVVNTFTEHFAWKVAEEIRADLLVETDDEDALAQKLAEFIWTNRNLLRKQCNEQESNQARESSSLSPSRKRRQK